MKHVIVGAHLRREDVEPAAVPPNPRPDRRAFTSGADYLRALQASTAVDVDPAFREAAEQKIDGVRRRWVARDNASLELVALVRRDDIERIREAGRELKQLF